MYPNPIPFFEGLEDPRRETKNKLHKLVDIVLLTLCATLCGAEGWVAIADWACEKEAWLRQYLELPNGIPSHDTISDLFARINPKQFEFMLAEWVEAWRLTLAGEHIAIDGKTLRGSREADGTTDHVVTAFASKGRVVLAQETVAEKSNEITAIPSVLTLVELEGATITVDAMGCQKFIAEVTIASKADYILAVKENQPNLYADVQRLLGEKFSSGLLPIHKTLDKGHGRVETRRYCLSTELDGIRNKEDWIGLAAIGMVESKRELPGKEPSIERRYFISSITDLPRFAEYVRAHWSTENSQHHVLDVCFGEDKNRTRKDHSAKNLAVIRRMSLNLLRRDGKDKRGMGRRKLQAMLHDDYRANVVFGKMPP